MSKEGMVPKVRFYNFNDEWFIKSLEEISEIIMGQSPKSEYYTDNPSDYILVQGNADIKNGSVAPRAYTSKPTKLAEKGNIILTVRAPVGEVAKTDYEVVLGRGVSSLKGNEFLYQKLLMMNKVNYWEKFSTGSTFQSINSNDIRNAKLLVPIAEEQQKIGDLFEKLDQAILLQQQVLEATKDYKQSMLQKMFPKKGKKVPEIRFKEFEGKWENKKLGDLLSYEQPTKYLVESSEYDDSYKTPVLTAGKSFLLGYTNEKTGIYNKGDIILFDDFTTAFKYVNFDFKVKSSATKFLTAKENNNLRFLYEAMKSIHYPVDSHKRYWISEYTTLKIYIPSLEEQQKIGSFFKTLDEKIEQEEKKLETYQSMKKALMQRMFV